MISVIVKLLVLATLPIMFIISSVIVSAYPSSIITNSMYCYNPFIVSLQNCGFISGLVKEGITVTIIVIIVVIVV